MNKILKTATTLIFLATSISTIAQTSNTVTYGNAQGVNVISRPNSGFTSTVQCSHRNGIEAEFTIGTINLKTTVGPYLTNNGYERDGYTVNSMEVIGNDCYFCGKKWHEKEVHILTMEGTWLVEHEYLYTGFVGRFNIASILAGGTTFETTVFGETSELDKLTYTGNGFIVLGKEATNNTPVVLELSTWILGWSYQIATSTRSDEYFKDVVSCGTKTVLASRFDGSINSTFLEKKIGLRYGDNSNFCANCNTIYNYDVQGIFTFGGVGFSSVGPISICKTHTGNEVVVAYLGQQYSWTNIPFMFKVSSEGASTIDFIFTNDNHRYSKISEIRFPQPLDTPRKMVMLMENTNGKSTLRFPIWGNSLGTKQDTILYDNNLKIQSIHPLQAALGEIYVNCGGYNPNDANKVMLIQQHLIHSASPWDLQSCRSRTTGTLIKDIIVATPDMINSPLAATNIKYKAYSAQTFQVATTTMTNGC